LYERTNVKNFFREHVLFSERGGGAGRGAKTGLTEGLKVSKHQNCLNAIGEFLFQISTGHESTNKVVLD
jgi:hypothetical protein